MTYRIGQFFVFIGLIALVIFFASNQARQPAFSFFCGGILLMAAGIFLYMRTPRQPVETGRFRLLRSSARKKSKPKKQENQ